MRILFPTNLGEQSAETFDFAVHIAKKLNAEIALLHVYPVPMTLPAMDESRTADLADEMLQNAQTANEERLEAFKNLLVDRYQQSYPAIHAMECSLRMGFVGEEVARHADAIQADFVVITARRSSGLKRFLGGSDVSSIIRKCECPVITVPEQYHFHNMDKIAYATDLTFSDNEIIARLLLIGEKLGAMIKCFHVHDSNLDVENAIIKDFIEQYRDEANRRAITFDLVDNINIHDGIDYYVKNNNIDLLVVLKQKKYWLDIFEGSITKQLVFQEKIPMLIYHE